LLLNFNNPMIETLISSKTRIKLLLKFFLNSNTQSYLRGLESEFSESSNAIRLEVNKFEEAGMLTSHLAGNKKMYQANKGYPLFDEIHSILLKYIGIDSIIENVIERLGDVEQVYLAGDLSRGLDSQIIDLIFIGNVDKVYLSDLVSKAEKLIKRKIRYIIYSGEEFKSNTKGLETFNPTPLLIWDKK
jgi:hypothetical protein